VSSGHFHSAPNEHEAKARLERLDREFAIFDWVQNQKYKINRDYDMPYVSGCSRTSDVVYIDRDLPLTLSLNERKVSITPYLVEHERVEKALLNRASIRYPEAHRLATYVEYKSLIMMGIAPEEFERKLEPYTKADRLKTVKKVPFDIDLRPYRDSGDSILVKHVKGLANYDKQSRIRADQTP